MKDLSNVAEDGRWYYPQFPVDPNQRNLAIAMSLYKVGGGTVASLTIDWNLDEEDAAELLRLVKQGWAEGMWRERRVQLERRQT